MAGEEPLIVEAFLDRKEVAPGEAIRLAIKVTISEGYHIYGPNIDPEWKLIPTQIQFHLPAQPGEDQVSGGLAWKIVNSQSSEPKTMSDPILKKEIPVFEGVILHAVAIQIPEGFDEGEHNVEVIFKAQACDDSACYPPVEYGLEIPITVKAK